MRKIKIADITLKKLSEEREISLLFREKSAIANKAELLGADVIELPSIKNYREDAIIFKTIAQNVQDAVLAVPVGFEKENIAKVWECIKYAKKPRLQIELPISTLQMEYTYHVKQEKMLERIAELIKEAKTYCEDVEFSDKLSEDELNAKREGRLKQRPTLSSSMQSQRDRAQRLYKPTEARREELQL